MAAYNRRAPGNWILFGFGAPHAAISYLAGLLSIVTFFAHKPRFEGPVLTLKLRDWFSKRRRKDEDGQPDRGLSPYSSTFFCTIWYHEDRPLPATVAEERDTPHEQHEDKHVHQFLDEAFRGFWLGLLLATVLWLFGWHAEAWQPALLWLVVWLVLPVMLVTNWITAPLRYGLADKKRPNGEERSWWARIYDVAYLDSEHERSARAQTAVVSFEPKRKTWADRERERR